MNTQHTPTPWMQAGVSRYIVKDLESVSIASTTVPKGRNDKEEEALEKLAYANAAFIVRAVNSHDELLKALSVLKNSITGVYYLGEEKEIEIIDKAIAKAEGK